MVHHVGRPLENVSDVGQTNCRSRWAQRLAAFDGYGVKCFAFDNMVLDPCRLEGDTSCLMF